MRQKLFDLIESSEDFLLRKLYNYLSFGGYTDYLWPDLEFWRSTLTRIKGHFLAYLEGCDTAEEIHADENVSGGVASAHGIAEAQSYYHQGFALVRALGVIKYLRDSFLNLVDSAIYRSRERVKARALILRYFDKFEIGFVTEWVNLEVGSTKQVEASVSPASLREGKPDLLPPVEP